MRAYRSIRCLALAALLLAAAGLRSEDLKATRVGMSGRLDQVVLPGPELEVRPLEEHTAPFVLRVANVYPHGTAFRYDFTYYALEPGTYDLRTYLRHKDGSPLGDLPALKVEVQGVLPPGQILPHELPPRRAGWFPTYRLLLILGVALWFVGLFLILFLVRRRKRAGANLTARPITAADRLRPLVESALAGRLTIAQQAELERTLLAFWRRRLGLDHARPAEALAQMRAHPEAGALLGQLETWLHRPGTAEQVDVGALLKPYQNVPAEALRTGVP
jgi:hypothetical protein